MLDQRLNKAAANDSESLRSATVGDLAAVEMKKSRYRANIYELKTYVDETEKLAETSERQTRED